MLLLVAGDRGPELLIACLRLRERAAAGQELDLEAGDELAVAQLPGVQAGHFGNQRHALGHDLRDRAGRFAHRPPSARAMPMAASIFGQILRLGLELALGGLDMALQRVPDVDAHQGLGIAGQELDLADPEMAREGDAVEDEVAQLGRVRVDEMGEQRIVLGGGAATGRFRADELLEVAHHPVLALAQEPHHEHQVLRCAAHDLLGDLRAVRRGRSSGPSLSGISPSPKAVSAPPHRNSHVIYDGLGSMEA